jgi:hypothetical protein
MNLDSIVERAERYAGRANRAAINRAFRAADESHLWPVRGRFNATERAIRRVQRYMRETGEDLTGLAYALILDDELSRIVNGVL